MPQDITHINDITRKVYLFKICGDGVVPFADSVWLCEKIHDNIVKKLPQRGLTAASGLLIGRTPTGRVLKRQHAHAHLIPLTTSRQSVDAVALFLSRNLSPDMRRVLDSIDRRIEVLVSRDLEEWVWGEQLYKVVEVNLRRAGRLADAVRQQLVRLLPEKPVKKWRSYTPYVPPRHLRRKYGVAEDVLRELKFRKLPPGEISVVAQVGLNVWNCEITVEEVPTSSLESQRAQRELHGFTYCRLPGKPQPPQQARFYLELEFSQGVRGPIALGYGCHFGLGLFESQESADEIASS